VFADFALEPYFRLAGVLVFCVAIDDPGNGAFNAFAVGVPVRAKKTLGVYAPLILELCKRFAQNFVEKLGRSPTDQFIAQDRAMPVREAIQKQNVAPIS